MKIHTDCRHYRGSVPCEPNKLRGKECPTCDEHDPIGLRILLIKLGAPGDVLRTTALLPGIRRKWPNCELTWLTRANASELLANLGEIDRILTVEEDGVTQLLGEAFDVSICLDNEPLAASVIVQVASSVVLGFTLSESGRVIPASSETEPWLEMALFDRLKKENRKTYQAHMREIIELDTEIDPIQIRLTEGERRAASNRLKELGLAGVRPIAFNTGSGDRWQTKRWPMSSFIELANLLAHEDSHPILLLGGPGEDEDNRRLVTERPDRFVYPGVMLLREFLAVVAMCRLLVTSDTLALHVGLGTGVPTVVFFGPTSASEIEESGPLLKVVAPVDCVCCYLKECDKVPYCMDELTPSLMFQQIQESGFLNKRESEIRAASSAG